MTTQLSIENAIIAAFNNTNETYEWVLPQPLNNDLVFSVRFTEDEWEETKIINLHEKTLGLDLFCSLEPKIDDCFFVDELDPVDLVMNNLVTAYSNVLDTSVIISFKHETMLVEQLSFHEHGHEQTENYTGYALYNHPVSSFFVPFPAPFIDEIYTTFFEMSVPHKNSLYRILDNYKNLRMIKPITEWSHNDWFDCVQSVDTSFLSLEEIMGTSDVLTMFDLIAPNEDGLYSCESIETISYLSIAHSLGKDSCDNIEKMIDYASNNELDEKLTMNWTSFFKS